MSEKWIKLKGSEDRARCGRERGHVLVEDPWPVRGGECAHCECSEIIVISEDGVPGCLDNRPHIWFPIDGHMRDGRPVDICMHCMVKRIGEAGR